MAELVDALDSKSGYRKVVGVRFPLWAQTLSRAIGTGFFNLRQRRELAHVSWRELKNTTTQRSGIVERVWVRPTIWEDDERSEVGSPRSMKRFVERVWEDVLSKAKNGSPFEN